MVEKKKKKIQIENCFVCYGEEKSIKIESKIFSIYWQCYKWGSTYLDSEMVLYREEKKAELLADWHSVLWSPHCKFYI